MAEKLDAIRIEKARKEKVRMNKCEEAKQRIRDTINSTRIPFALCPTTL